MRRLLPLAAVAPSDERGSGRVDFPEVTSDQFCDAWEAMEQDLLSTSEVRAGVGASAIVIELALALAILLGLVLVFAFGARGWGEVDAPLTDVLQALVVLACAVAIALLRPRAEAERFRAAREMDGLVRRILEEHMERASEE